MADYKELREGWEYTVSSSTSSGTRVFIDETGGADTLPELGDGFSATYPNTICTDITMSLYHFESEVCKQKYVCSYTTSSGGEDDYSDADDSDPENLRTQTGSEMISIDEPKEWFWQSSGGRYEARLFKNTVRGSISKTIVFTERAKYIAHKAGVVIPGVGKINNDTLITDAETWNYPYKAGTVLFVGTDDRLVYDSDGNKNYEVTLNFAFRILDVTTVETGGTTIEENVEYSWNYYLNPKQEEGNPDFEKVGQKAGADNDTEMIYKSVSFVDIFETDI